MEYEQNNQVIQLLHYFELEDLQYLFDYELLHEK